MLTLGTSLTHKELPLVVKFKLEHMRNIILIFCLLAVQNAFAQWKGKFEQLENVLPTPNSYRSASGAPGEDYWQQRADYSIDAELKEDTQLLTGKETITYYNNSPETLTFLWLQLDQNILASGNMTDQTKTSRMVEEVPTLFFPFSKETFNYEGGFKILSVKNNQGESLPYMINHTMMRINIPPLAGRQSMTFKIEWSYRVNDRMKYDERSGFDYFPEDNNYIFGVAQWFPRLCVFDDYEGWQNKQFLGSGEFALVFGNYDVNLTLPSDYVVAATGVLQNPTAVLGHEQQLRLEKARHTFDAPVFIITEEEAKKNEKSRSKSKSTWRYHADNVRDFAFAASRKFIWDAMAVKTGSTTPLAQSFYPKEGNPLWSQESTKAIRSALEVYSQRTFDYPYPTAISVNCADQGMEYPMICFNGGRPPKEGQISDRLRESTVSVIVHEVGHNFFPMIVNSDERQWTWMDEGLNSFLEKETIQERYPTLGYTSNTPAYIVNFMKGDKSIMRPIMTNSENHAGNFSSNGYSKPAAALTVLRETVLGKELFDKAFKSYAQLWAFKHPRPADFFRTMENASAVDLDWFWRGWFYTTDHVDINLSEVKWYKAGDKKIDFEKKISRNDKKPIIDFTGGPSYLTVTPSPATNGEFRSTLKDAGYLQKMKDKNIYELTFTNEGGLISPIVIEWTYTDGSKEKEIIPAEIWRNNENRVQKVFAKDKQVESIAIDPDRATADTETSNNNFPRNSKSAFDQFKEKQ